MIIYVDLKDEATEKQATDLEAALMEWCDLHGLRYEAIEVHT
jgi:hypothetical protein